MMTLVYGAMNIYEKLQVDGLSSELSDEDRDFMDAISTMYVDS